MEEINRASREDGGCGGEAGADTGRTRVDPRRSRTRVQPTGATDGITITRWSLGLFITFALSVVTAAFTLVWNQTLKLGDTQVQLVAHVAGLDARVTGLETRVAGVETEVRELAELIRDRAIAAIWQSTGATGRPADRREEQIRMGASTEAATRPRHT